MRADDDFHFLSTLYNLFEHLSPVVYYSYSILHYPWAKVHPTDPSDSLKLDLTCLATLPAFRRSPTSRLFTLERSHVSQNQASTL